MISNLKGLRDLYLNGGAKEVFRGIRDYAYYKFHHIYNDFRVELLKIRHGRFYDVNLPKYNLTVDLNDKGIGKDLALNGIREPHSYNQYQSCISSLKSKDEGCINVLEIGANIGYYALVPPSIRNDVRVFAAELSKNNTKLLKYNVQNNGFKNVFSIDNVALSNKNATENVYLSKSSNLHSIKQVSGNEIGDEVVEIETMDANRWLQSQGLSQQDIDVIRMDLEGAEYEILNSLTDIKPKIVHIEIHPRFLSEPEIEYVLQRLDSFGLQIKSISSKDRLIDSPENLTNLSRSINQEIVLSKE